MCINPLPKHKLMKMKLTLMTLLLTMTVGLWAQNTTPRLVVWQKNGEKVYFELNEMPETTFENGLPVRRSAPPRTVCLPWLACPSSAPGSGRRACQLTS